MFTENEEKKYENVCIDAYKILEPSGLVAIRKYLGSGLIPGIGPKMAERIVEKFGERSLGVIEREPGRLKKISGIGKNRIDMISSAFKEQKSLREVVIFLNSLSSIQNFSLVCLETACILALKSTCVIDCSLDLFVYNFSRKNNLE